MTIKHHIKSHREVVITLTPEQLLQLVGIESDQILHIVDVVHTRADVRITVSELAAKRYDRSSADE